MRVSFLQHREVAWTKTHKRLNPSANGTQQICCTSIRTTGLCRTLHNLTKGMIELHLPILPPRRQSLQVKSSWNPIKRRHTDPFQSSKHPPLDLLTLCREHTCEMSAGTISSLKGNAFLKQSMHVGGERGQLPSHRAQITLPTSGRGEECSYCWDQSQTYD